jgi:hypothetical protein
LIFGVALHDPGNCAAIKLTDDDLTVALEGVVSENAVLGALKPEDSLAGKKTRRQTD